MAALGQTIMVVNRSGKVVSTSKHLVNVFKEAKSAYLEKKAEIKANKEEDLQKKRAKKVLAISLADAKANRSEESAASPRHSERRHSGHSRHSTESPALSPRRRHSGQSSHSHRRSESDRDSRRPPVDRGYSDSFYSNDRRPRRTKTDLPSPLRYMEEAGHECGGRELVRRHSYSEAQSPRSSISKSKRMSDGIDMDLAYGELPPPLPSHHIAEEQELRTKVTTLQKMLEEANCVQYSVSSVVKNLENNPDAMAAVALTMAEISNIASKLGPGALMALKGSFPAVVALLLSPEFLIAAGVGVGITVVALGGYKIIKKIKAKKGEASEGGPDELEEIDTDVSRIETWRRGIADAETASIATSVEGEFVTPGAAKELRKEGRLPPSKEKSQTKPKESKKEQVSKVERKAREKEAKQKKEVKEKAEKKQRKEQKVLQDKLDKHAKKEQAEQEKKRSEQKLLL